MYITERSRGHVTVLDLVGPLVGGIGTESLRDKVNSLVLQHRMHVIVNLGKVAHIDSGGLGEMASALLATRRAGGNIKLLNLTKRNHELLSITRLATQFDTFDDEADAVGSFAAPVVLENALLRSEAVRLNQLARSSA